MTQTTTFVRCRKCGQKVYDPKEQESLNPKCNTCKKPAIRYGEYRTSRFQDRFAPISQ